MAIKALQFGIPAYSLSASSGGPSTNGTAFALPGVSVLLTYQLLFSSAPSAVSILIEGSLDGTTFYTIVTLTATAGTGGSVLTSASFVRATISSKTGGGTTTVSFKGQSIGVGSSSGVFGSLGATQVAFGDSLGAIAGSNSLIFDGTALIPLVLYAGGIIDNTSSGVFQVNASVNAPGLEPGFQSALGIKASVTTTQDTSDTLQGGYFDIFYDINHNISAYIAGQDFTNNIDILTGKTLLGYTAQIFDLRLTGAGTLSDLYGHSLTPYIDATQVTVGRGFYMDPPQLSGGAAIGIWYAMEFADISGLVTSGAKGLLNYGSGKCIIDSLGVVKSPHQAGGDATSCTGATIGSGSRANGGFVTATTTGASTIVITFPYTAPTGWAVVPTNLTTANLIRQSARTTTTATLAGVTVSGDIISYVAFPY